MDSVALTAKPVYPGATILGVRKGSRRERSDPSVRELVVLNLERLDQKLGALMSEPLVGAPEPLRCPVIGQRKGVGGWGQATVAPSFAVAAAACLIRSATAAGWET